MTKRLLQECKSLQRTTSETNHRTLNNYWRSSSTRARMSLSKISSSIATLSLPWKLPHLMKAFIIPMINFLTRWNLTWNTPRMISRRWIRFGSRTWIASSKVTAMFFNSAPETSYSNQALVTLTSSTTWKRRKTKPWRLGSTILKSYPKENLSSASTHLVVLPGTKTKTRKDKSSKKS